MQNNNWGQLLLINLKINAMRKLVIALKSGMSLFLILASCTTEYPLTDAEEANDIYEDVISDPSGDNSGNTSDTDSTTDSPQNSEEDPDAGYVTYYGDVEPLLNQLCVACHNSSVHEDGVDISTFDLARSQVDDIIESMQEEEDDVMPPGGPVADDIIQTFVSWKNDGLREGEADSTDPGNPDGTYTYTGDIKTLIDQECIACHGATGAAAGFDISTYQKTVNQIDLIIARIDLQTGQNGVMPVAGRMAEEKIQAFIAWQSQGMPE